MCYAVKGVFKRHLLKHSATGPFADVSEIALWPERHREDKPMELSYTRRGDYLLPDLKLDEPPPELAEPITKYGIMRRSFLKEHRTITYNRLLLTERLFPHLREIQREAEERLEILMKQLVIRHPPPDKAADGLAWVAHMNTLKHSAEEIILDELIYA